MTLLVAYVFSVGGFAVLCLAAVAWMVARPRSTAARRALIAIVLVYAAASARAVPWVLSRPLVWRLPHFSSSNAPRGSAAIVVLGAGSFTVHGAYQRLGVLDLNSSSRVLEAAHVFRSFDPAWIISSGGAPDGVDLEPSAVTMCDALVRLGIPRERIVLESRSRNTREEALLVAPLVRSLPVDRVVIVTTDIHMRRALAAFRAAGVEATPAPALDPLNSQSRLRSFIPTTDGLRFTRDVVHEYAGLLEYAGRGWLRF